MNLKQINEFRVSHGLTALVKPAAKKSTGNAAKRAQTCRDIKALRNKGGK